MAEEEKKHFDIYIELFCNYLRSVKSYSENTIVNYRKDLLQFAEFCYKNWNISTISNINTDIIRSYLSELRLKRRMSSTIIRKRSALSSFIRFLEQKGFMQKGLVSFPKGFRGERKLPESFTKNQITNFLLFVKNQIKNDTNVFEYRDYVMIIFLSFCGVRASELINMKKNHIDSQNCIIKVTGKGNKQRLVPFPDDFRKDINCYIRLTQMNNWEFLFCNKSGKKLTRRGLFYILVKKVEKYPDPVHMHPHKFRHTFSITYLRSGGDVFTLQALLGHGSLDMVRYYAQIAEVDIQQAHRRASPDDNMHL